ncbi:hypothetical protein HMPREF9088_2156 [Enterococcus italicus DSM 15952]|uniref:Uncharacterized protein n=1 Tax=Enterococcus italicus (strain DSM 15952 / CCUG 50447 / LMG 22039 / TP 1.5) TaxID=888064 RepID=E6LIG6_ENTI1|nr:hypothetical protein HMPREF9088_2156 [Enterococcus italicus DSM 15952]
MFLPFADKGQIFEEKKKEQSGASQRKNGHRKVVVQDKYQCFHCKKSAISSIIPKKLKKESQKWHSYFLSTAQ